MDQTRKVNTHDLLPRPKSVRLTAGLCRLVFEIEARCTVHDARVERALNEWHSTLPRMGTSYGGTFVTVILVTVDPTEAKHPEGYRLSIAPQRIELVGGSPTGCFHGLQTISQMTRLARCAAGAGMTYGEPIMLPCCRIDDAPDFDTRGLLYDVTRGKVPRLDTLKLLVDRLAEMKINQLQLYIEHAFVFSFDPEICAERDGLTPDEVRELDQYCKDRFIDLVPAVATLGHMGRILSMPKYRHLAEVEATVSFDAMTWPQRARGLTLDCTNPESHRLVERIWSDVLDAFSSPVVNICGDEPWDLGKGKNVKRFANGCITGTYVAHLRRTHDICAARGRRTQIWSDVIRNHPEQLGRLPGDSTLLHWGYDDTADYEGTRALADSGLDTIVCPGTSGWKRIINAIGLAERNISTFARVGRKCGATGLLNTDWGDHGHFNALACSWHGIALGAALAWSADHPTGEDFDRRFARTLWQQDDATGVRLLRAASQIADRCETWRLMWMPESQTMDEATWPDAAEVVELRERAIELRRWCGSTATENSIVRDDLTELATAARFSELFADKAALMSRRCNGEAVDSSTLAERIRSATKQYADYWNCRNKPSGLNDIESALESVAQECDGQT